MDYKEALKWTEDSLAQGRVLPEQESLEYMIAVKSALRIATEIVKCKDCINGDFCGCTSDLEVMGYEGFCSKGERRKEKEKKQMTVIRFGKWSHKVTALFVYDRIYWNGDKPTPFCVKKWRYVGE